MTTRIISITLVVVFLIGIVMGSVWAVWDATRPENQPLDLTQSANKLNLDPEAASLDEFEPLTEPLTELRFEDRFVGDGLEAVLDDNITVIYLGALASNGEIIEVGDRETFGLSFENANLLEGWVEGLPGMRVGGVRRLFVPASLAYGSLGSPDLGIPADADMVYDFELVGLADSGVEPVSIIEDFTPTSERLAELVIEDTVEGQSGRAVVGGDTVTVHYVGALMSDGTVFDSSFSRGVPATFSLDGVIVGWREGLVGMKVGGQRRLLIPAEKAYGSSGTPGIPPDSDLVFDVELIEIIDPAGSVGS